MTSDMLRDRSRAFAHGGAIAVAALGVAVLLGWLLDVPALKQVVPGLISMKVNSAVAFLTAGLALHALHGEPGPARMRSSRALAAVGLLLGLATSLEYVFGTNLGLDELLWHDDPQPALTRYPGRMAPSTSVSFVFVGLALLLTRRRSGTGSVARWLAIPALFVAVLALIGYAYDVTSLVALGSRTGMALHTALGFLMLSLAIIAVDPTDGFMAILTSDTSGGQSARRLLPFTTLLLFVLGWLRIVGERAGLFGPGFGLPLMVISSIVVTSGVVAWHALLLHRADLKRRDDEARILALNASLEQRVEQLGALLPICAWCKRIRDDADHWHSVEEHISTRTETRFTHAMCPDCERRMMTDTPAPGAI